MVQRWRSREKCPRECDSYEHVWLLRRRRIDLARRGAWSAAIRHAPRALGGAVVTKGRAQLIKGAFCMGVILTSATNDDARRRQDAACPHGHKAGDADRWGTRKLGCRPGNGAPLRTWVAFLVLPCERGSNSHTDVARRPRLSLAL